MRKLPTNSLDNLRKVLEPGDVILFHTHSVINWAIRKLTKSYWGHSAMYIGDGLYIESIASGVYINDIIVLGNADIKIYRHDSMTVDIAYRIVESTKTKSKKGYDYKAILYLFKLLVTGKRFGNDGKIGIEDKYICSELIALAYQEMGLKVIDELNYDEVIPADFEYSPNFKSIDI